MTTSSKTVFVSIKDLTEKFSTRAMGALVREKLLLDLSRHDKVVLDMGDIQMSPSFADECFGFLIVDLGLDTIRHRLSFVGADRQAKILLQHVMLRRSSNRSYAA
ncbi:STAS-like domain-containing protein [Acidihalobacter ferrooxydans]|nr:STAS-like domain-containing protein [Acidihalobacter ferrooxydans]